MTSLTQNFLNPNSKPLVIGGFNIRQDEYGRYSLADLHKASGNLAKHKPSNFLRVEQTQELIKEIEQVSDMSLSDENHFSNMRSAVKVIHGGNKRGTYAVKEMVYAYAMWISAKFHLMVIRAYDSLVMEWVLNDKQTISPDQASTLHHIVHERANGSSKIIKQMWSRLKNHFGYRASYRDLQAVHFEDAKHYLEIMDINFPSEKNQPPSLPFPPEVIQVAQQITNEFNGGKFASWFVSGRNGVLTAQPLPHGYYPFNVKEFTRHFDGVLNILYGSDTLSQGRYFLSQV